MMNRTYRRESVIVIGAGIAGLSAAIQIACDGFDVTVIEKEMEPGGKMRQVFVDGRPTDGGPTVFTMKWAFERLLSSRGFKLEDYVKLVRAGTLARHAWRDGARLDLMADIDTSAAKIEAFSDRRNAQGYFDFCRDSAMIFNTLKDTYIAAPRPNPIDLGRRIGLQNVDKMLALKPFLTLWSALGHYFPDRRLQQLFGRYATYCGSSPFSSPATLMLVAHVEQDGVWMVRGGMHALAKALEKIALLCGVRFSYGTPVDKIMMTNDEVAGVKLADGRELVTKNIVFNGDMSALGSHLLGDDVVAYAAKPVLQTGRSLSAMTWAISGEVQGFDLAHHTVLFSDNYKLEFDDIFKRGRVPEQPTTYLCAQDRTSSGELLLKGNERLLCLINAPANGDKKSYQEAEVQQCLTNTLAHMKACGLTLKAETIKTVATSPQGFNRLFPASGGALYGRASHGWMASFQRPGARTKIKGLYLAGGSVHPGPGVPMACLSGQLAAESLVSDRALTPVYRQVAIYGGMPTA